MQLSHHGSLEAGFVLQLFGAVAEGSTSSISYVKTLNMQGGNSRTGCFGWTAPGRQNFTPERFIAHESIAMEHVFSFYCPAAEIPGSAFPGPVEL